MANLLSSSHNPRIRELLSLQEKARTRRERGLAVVEGRREAMHAIEGGLVPRELYVCPDLYHETEEFMGLLAAIRGAAGGSLFEAELTGDLYSKVAYRGGTEGLVCVFEATPPGLGDLDLGPDPLVVVLEGVEKPGNLGAVLRSCDAAGVDAVVFCDPLTDLYNPNLVRASLGAVFTCPVAVATSVEAVAFLKERGIKILSAQLQDSVPYYETSMRGGTAIVMGTEATGVTDIWREAADAHILIPMRGRLDSLNVSVSAAVLLYEAVRQRLRDA